ncbi:MAG: tetratricopeptide repeat protein [Micromonosporaceae bacterium]|nr:tetratricopeptide repeat protein [Micromonosporaceae bacterium]
MAKSDVLARVKNDLALGHTHTAIQRLRTLVAVDPNDLELHRLLAEVYRQTGNLVEAGRWSFLTEDARPEELAAFERANPDPWLRLRLIRWNGDPATLPDKAAWSRLWALRQAAERAGPPDRWQHDDQAATTASSRIPCLFVTAALVVLGALGAIGVVRAISMLLL